MLTGDASNTDPVCGKSPRHDIILKARQEAGTATAGIGQLTFRNERNSRLITKKG
ncbi:hypothetical protein [Archangium violaceum]|uniref:hypothetical protein n=1 Tax=Archangium violaceum TaxID=83451 RepID=UPI0037BF1E3D